MGGAFLVTAIAFSLASGIFHPYYVSLLAPFTAALVGGTVGQVLQRRQPAPDPRPLSAIGAGVVSELIVLHNTTGQPGWLGRALVAVVRASPPPRARPRRDRRGSAATALAAGDRRADDRPGDLVVPDARARDQRHVPRRGPGDRLHGRRSGRAARPGGATPGGSARRALPAGDRRRAGDPRPGAGIAPGTGAGPAAAAAGCSAATRPSLTEAVGLRGGQRRRHAWSPPASRAPPTAIIASGADVAGLGGFSGRESEVSVSWLANAVGGGRIRWVIDQLLRRRRRLRRRPHGRDDGDERGRAARASLQTTRRRERPGGPLRLPDERRRAGGDRGRRPRPPRADRR